MNITQQRNKGREEFDKKYSDIDKCPLQTKDGSKPTENLKSFINKIYIDIAKNEIERLEKEKRKNTVRLLDGQIVTPFIDTGYNKALEDQITYWKGQLLELEKEI